MEGEDIQEDVSESNQRLQSVEELSMSTLTTERAIIHLDCDSFFASVEAKRRSIPENVPLAVVQYNRVLTCNYPARRLGIEKGMKLSRFKGSLSEVKVVHVDTINLKPHSNSEADKWKYEKSDLRIYRQESAKIFNIARRFLREKDILCISSIDEAYIEINAEIYNFANDKFAKYVQLLQDHTDTQMEGDISAFTAIDFKLARAAVIAYNIRQAVFISLGYKLSAGIAGSKTVAKLASTASKPFSQRVIFFDRAMKFLGKQKISSVPDFGPALKKKVKKFLDPETPLRALQIIEPKILEKYMSPQAAHKVLLIATGQASIPVKEHILHCQVSSIKSFSGDEDLDYLKLWLHAMCNEVIDRCIEDFEATSRRPETVEVVIRNKETRRLIKARSALGNSIDSIFAVSENLLNKLANRKPCSMIGIACLRLEKYEIEHLCRFYSVERFFRYNEINDEIENIADLKVLSPVGHSVVFKQVSLDKTFLQVLKEKICIAIGLTKNASYFLKVFLKSEGMFQLTGLNKTLLQNGIKKDETLVVEFF